jgi:hypothetical protein
VTSFTDADVQDGVNWCSDVGIDMDDRDAVRDRLSDGWTDSSWMPESYVTAVMRAARRALDDDFDW